MYRPIKLRSIKTGEFSLLLDSFSKLSPFNKNNQLKKDVWTPSTQYKPVNSPVISYNATNNVLPLEQKKEEHIDYEKGKIYLT